LEDRTFEENVWDEEQREGDVVLYAIHAQVFDHAFDLCVANIGSVDVSLIARKPHVSHVSRSVTKRLNLVRTHHEV
jgi:hypothetical protein